MTKSVIAFGINNTLTNSRRPVGRELLRRIELLSRYYDLCIVSGDSFEQINNILLSRLELGHAALARLVVLPTNGTQMYKYDARRHVWRLCFSEDLPEEQKQMVTTTLESAARELRLWPKRPSGKVIEDRKSQITFAALGMDAPVTMKYRWAEMNAGSREQLLKKVTKLLPGFDVRLSGMTSLDVRPLSQRNNQVLIRHLDKAGLLGRPTIYIGNKQSLENLANALEKYKMLVIPVEGSEDTRFVMCGLIAAAKASAQSRE